jgi:hypothetical protein
VRLLLDEMLSPAIAFQLRIRGHYVEAVTQRPDLKGETDPFIFETAQLEHLTIVTYDTKDLRLIASEAIASGRTHAGLIFLASQAFPQRRSQTIGRLVTVLDSLLASGPDLANRELWLRAPG